MPMNERTSDPVSQTSCGNPTTTITVLISCAHLSLSLSSSLLLAYHLPLPLSSPQIPSPTQISKAKVDGWSGQARVDRYIIFSLGPPIYDRSS